MAEDKREALRKIGCHVPTDCPSWTDFEAPISEVLTLPFAVTIKPVEVKYNHVALLFEKLASIERRLATLPNESTHNAKCNVHVPGLGLLAIDEVMLLQDACTDMLAEYVELGWRIIAACPQPDQRRPDYVLGRTKEKTEC